ncbi:MAG TPA: hypothetical protein VLS96_14070 [Nodosilinea sp.]|nr:hypothetical protein [Nodosilinea sp.]
MKLSGWMVLPLVLGLSTMTVACDAGGDREAEEELEPTGAEPLEGEEEESEEGEGDD